MSSTIRSVRVVVEPLESRLLFSAEPLSGVSASPMIDIQPFVTNTTPSGYTPAQLRHAYGFDQITRNDGHQARGTGQTIAIIGAFSDPNIAADLATFSMQWGLPQMDGAGGRPSFTIVPMAGGISTDQGWGMEMTLDVQWAHAMAPKANIVLVEATDNSLASLLAAVDIARNMAGVSVVSMSWGTGDFPTEASYDLHFRTPPGHGGGVTFVAASGDNGAPVSWPATSPNVIAVGGTTLNIDANGNYLSESAWSGSGGGLSTYVPAPSYQANGYAVRSSPDISYDANPATGVPIYDSFGYGGQSGWFRVGGTSIGAPQIAALIARADQQRAEAGKSALSGRTQTLPAIYSAPARDFHDIISGATTGVPQFSAAIGYDLATGFGSPYANRFSNMLLLV